MTCFCVNTSVFKDVDMHYARYPEEPRTTFLKCFLNDLFYSVGLTCLLLHALIKLSVA